MKNDLYRKLTSITLMTIMFAGGMTIAIPGETPTAVAQTGTLSVSAEAAGVFGGAQVIEIVIDDPDLDEVGDNANDAVPDVEVDGNAIAMTQASTGKWYAYVAAMAFVDTGIAGTEDTDADGPNNDYGVADGFLDGSPIPADDLRVLVFPFDGDVEITANGGDELITLDYDDHSDIATISVDRNDVPAGGQVHITIGDFQLNLDPINADVWTLIDGKAATYNNVLNSTAPNEDNPVPSSIDLTGTSGELGVSASDTYVIMYNDGDGPDGVVTIEETKSNTGVFESEEGDISEISVNMTAVSGDTFTIGYADDSQQVIVDDFSSTLELVADGTWNSGDTLTVRLTNENLNINTLADDDMKITDRKLPTMTLGTPITIADFGLTPANSADRLADSGSDAGTVKLTASSDLTVFNAVLSTELLAMFQNPDLYHFVNYYPDPDSTLVTSIATDAQLIDAAGENATTTNITPGLTRVQAQAHDDVDGLFALTFTTNFNETLDTDTDNAAMNTALNLINADAGNTIADAMTTASGAITTARSQTDTGVRATGISEALVTLRTAINVAAGEAGEIITGVSILKNNTATLITDAPTNDDDPKATTPSEFETPRSLLAKIKAGILMNIETESTTFVLEVFTFGTGPDGTVNDAIYRPLLEETSSDSGVFEGTIEYKMLNQLTIDDAATYNDVKAVDDELVIILDDGYTGTSAPEVTYDGDHVREDAPTYTGEVSFDSATYRVADEVTVILVDPDLNVDAGAIDIYTVDVTSTDETATLLHLEIGGCHRSRRLYQPFHCASPLTTATRSRERSTFRPAAPQIAQTPTTAQLAKTSRPPTMTSGTHPAERSNGATLPRSAQTPALSALTGPSTRYRQIDSVVTVYVSVDDGDFDESSTSVERHRSYRRRRTRNREGRINDHKRRSALRTNHSRRLVLTPASSSTPWRS